MRFRAFLIASLTALALASTAWAASPPSFAVWAEQWKVASDRAIDAPPEPCQKQFVDNGLKAGACTVRNVRLVYARATPIWERAINRVAQGQTPACRSAIHTYWRATRTQQDADLRYLDRHARVTVTQLNVDLSGRPYSTMDRVAANAKMHAIRVCG